MPPDDRIPEQPSPYEELVEAFGDSGHKILKAELLKFLRVLDFKAQAAFDRTIRNEKVISSLDDCVALMAEESEELKDKLRKDFYNKPARGNATEGSHSYQEAQGLSSRMPDMVEDEDMWDAEIIMDDPYDQANFDDALDLLQNINPSVSPYRLFKLLSNS
jgi:hypothetical protein